MFLSPLVSPSQQQETLPATQNRELSSLVKRVLRQTQVTINIRVYHVDSVYLCTVLWRVVLLLYVYTCRSLNSNPHCNMLINPPTG
jgi:hypothetical protein